MTAFSFDPTTWPWWIWVVLALIALVLVWLLVRAVDAEAKP
jgi:hypothetical protein